MTISSIDLAIVGTYVLAMLGVGYYVFKRAPNLEEYLVAGRSMTTPILVCTLASTYYGLDVLFGTSEIGFNDGVVAFFGYSELSLGFYVFAATDGKLLNSTPLYKGKPRFPLDPKPDKRLIALPSPIGGIQSGMGYLGAANLGDLQEQARYIRISSAGQREAGAHDVIEMKAGSR